MVTLTVRHACGAWWRPAWTRHGEDAAARGANRAGRQKGSRAARRSANCYAYSPGLGAGSGDDQGDQGAAAAVTARANSLRAAAALSVLRHAPAATKHAAQCAEWVALESPLLVDGAVGGGHVGDVEQPGGERGVERAHSGVHAGRRAVEEAHLQRLAVQVRLPRRRVARRQE